MHNARGVAVTIAKRFGALGHIEDMCQEAELAVLTAPPGQTDAFYNNAARWACIDYLRSMAKAVRGPCIVEPLHGEDYVIEIEIEQPDSSVFDWLLEYVCPDGLSKSVVCLTMAGYKQAAIAKRCGIVRMSVFRTLRDCQARAERLGIRHRHRRFEAVCAECGTYVPIAEVLDHCGKVRYEPRTHRRGAFADEVAEIVRDLRIRPLRIVPERERGIELFAHYCCE